MNSLFLNVRIRNSMNFLRATLNGGWEGDVLVDQGNGGFEDQGEFVLKDAVPGVEQEQWLNHEKVTYAISRIIRQISPRTCALSCRDSLVHGKKSRVSRILGFSLRCPIARICIFCPKFRF